MGRESAANVVNEGLVRRKIERAIGGGLVHLHVVDGPDDRDEYELDEVPCCMNGAFEGPRGCTCWVPVFDLEQTLELDLAAPTVTRSACCHDCAYRNGSPERADGYTGELLDVAGEGRSSFSCHVGMRRAVLYRHPNGREIAAQPGDYEPPVVDGRAYKADGSPAELCAGWAAHRAVLLG